MIYLLTAAIAWTLSQGTKHLLRLKGANKKIFRAPGSKSAWLMPSGGMPSTHSATVAAFATIVGLREGVDSGLFALAFMIAAIVIYDSMRVRYASGRQGDLLNNLLTELKSRLSPVRVAHGHTPKEVLVGVIIGITIGIIVFITTK